MKVKAQKYYDDLKHYAKLVSAVKSMPRAAQVWFDAHFPASNQPSDSENGGHDWTRTSSPTLIKRVL
jgi:hypothetical protein